MTDTTLTFTGTPDPVTGEMTTETVFVPEGSSSVDTARWRKGLKSHTHTKTDSEALILGRSNRLFLLPSLRLRNRRFDRHPCPSHKPSLLERSSHLRPNAFPSRSGLEPGRVRAVFGWSPSVHRSKIRRGRSGGDTGVVHPRIRVQVARVEEGRDETGPEAEAVEGETGHHAHAQRN